jgi:hypothetical protein
MEEWRDIPGYEGAYQVSNLGRVRSLERRVRVVPHGIETTRRVPPRILKPAPHGSKQNHSGHLAVVLGRGNTRDVHPLVLRAFVGPPPQGHECLHLDHNPSNNCLDNLKWGTRSENILMDYRDGNR